MCKLTTFRLCASLIAFLYCSPVTQAALTAINDSPDFYDEPNLIGDNPYPENANPSVLETLYGESNLRPSTIARMSRSAIRASRRW